MGIETRTRNETLFDDYAELTAEVTLCPRKKPAIIDQTENREPVRETVTGSGKRRERPYRKPAVFGPGRCSSVTPAGSGRSPTKESLREGCRGAGDRR